MTVSEIIAILEKCSPDATVCVEANQDPLANGVKEYVLADGTRHVYIADEFDYLDEVILGEDIEERYNQKLRDIYGNNITVAISSYCDDDGITRYIFTHKCVESVTYETVEQAYEAADDYLRNIELYI